jgi:hypothetical protein
MNNVRPIRAEERILIEFLLYQLKLKIEDYPYNTEVEEYEGGIMGSIGLGKPNAVYQRDLVQVRYVDVDGIPVIITMTLDENKQLLDLDFWKEDFSKLLVYPTPEKISFL